MTDEEHLRWCTDAPEPDPAPRRRSWGGFECEFSGRVHVCAHVAESVLGRRYYLSSVVLDSGAFEGMQRSCEECGQWTDSGKPPGDRWLACRECVELLSISKGWDGLDDIAPRQVERDRGDFERWWARVSDSLPRMPPGVAEQWVFRHWDHSPYHHVPVRDLDFRLESWSLDRLRQLRVGDGCRFDEAKDVRVSLKSPRTWVQEQTVALRTFPVPIIAWEGPKLYGLRTPQLLEGHRRFTYLLHLAYHEPVEEEHAVWVATATPR